MVALLSYIIILHIVYIYYNIFYKITLWAINVVTQTAHNQRIIISGLEFGCRL